MKKSFLYNTLILVFANILVRLMGFLYRIPLTNMLGDKGIGFYSAAFQIYILFYIISASAIPNSMAKLVSEKIEYGKRKEAHKLFVTTLKVSFLVSLMFGAILFGLSGVIADAISKPETRLAIMSLSPTLVIMGMVATLRGYFQGLHNMFPTALSQVFEQLINAVMSIVLALTLLNINLEYGVMGGTLGTGCGVLVALITLAVIYYKNKKKIDIEVANSNDVPASSLTLLKELFSVMFPFIVGGTVFTMTGLVDVVMIQNRLLLSLDKDTVDVIYGQYTGKYITILNLPAAVLTSISMSVIPRISLLTANKKYEQIKRELEKLFKIIFVLIIPMAFGLSILGSNLLQILFPYSPGGGYLFKYGAYTIIFVAIMKIGTAVLQASGNYWEPVKNGALAVTLKIALTYILVGTKFFNIYGAIISAIVTFMLLAFLNIRSINEKLNLKLRLFKNIYKPLFSSIIMGIVCYYSSVKLAFLGNLFSTLIAIILSVVIYFIIMFKIDGVNKNELAFLFKRKKG